MGLLIFSTLGVCCKKEGNSCLLNTDLFSWLFSLCFSYVYRQACILIPIHSVIFYSVIASPCLLIITTTLYLKYPDYPSSKSK